MPLEIGVISDTHGLLRPEALAALRGVSHILHAGDVGGPEIIRALEAVAPVTVVRGNTDRDMWGRALPDEELIELAGVWFGVHHGHLAPGLEFPKAGARVVVSGHTHVPLIETVNGVLRLNPGSAGPRRFSLPVSLARVVVDDGRIDARIITLEVGNADDSGA